MKVAAYLKKIIVFIICICITASAALVSAFAAKNEGGAEVLANIETAASTDATVPAAAPHGQNAGDGSISTGDAVGVFLALLIIIFASGILLCVVCVIPQKPD